MSKPIEGFEVSEETIHGLRVLHTHITTPAIARHLKREMGEYITILTGKLSDLNNWDPATECLAECLSRLLEPYHGKPLLIIGMRNADLTADYLGPKVIQNIPTHFMSLGAFQCPFESVSALAPGVLAQTNLETQKIISGMAQAVHADCVILIDSSGVSNHEDVAASIRITANGLISHHNNEAFNQETFHIPVVVISVPLVWFISPEAVAAFHLKMDQEGESFTNSHVLLDLKPAVQIIARAILRALYPSLTLTELRQILEILV